MKTTLFLSILIHLLLAATATAQANQQLNILFILSDDAGYADFGFHGSKEMKTPHLDALAQEGMLFQQAYVSAAVCGPSRAGILTGKYQQRFGYEENNVPGYMSPSGITGDDMGLPLNQKTMADYLKMQSYTTGIIGKWHQGNADRFHPFKRGFDYFYGFRGGARSYFVFDENNPNHRPEDFLERGFKQFAETETYLTDAFANDAIEFINSNKAKPFFLFLSFTAVHAPMDAEEKDLKQFLHLTGGRQKLAAMNLSMDRAIGRVLKALKTTGIEENTLVIYTNDNGGPSDQNASDNSPLSGTKANHLEGGIRVPFLAKWPGIIKKQSHYKHPISTLDLLPTFYAAAGGEKTPKDIDGVNLLPFITGKVTQPPHQALYWKKETRAAIREGNWKLLRFPDRPAELYNLDKDIAETNNLAAKETERVQQLYSQLFAWELTLERPRWQLQRRYEGDAMKRMDRFRQ